MAGLSAPATKVTGVRLTDGSEVSAGTVVVATGVWTKPFLEPYRVEVPIRVVREQIVMINPGVEIGPVPVFSDLVSLQYIRPELGGEVLFGNSDISDVSVADPDNYLNRADDAFVDLTVDKVGTRFPGFTDAAISSSYARLLRRHARLEPRHLQDPHRRAHGGRRLQRARVQDRTGRRQAHRRPHRRRAKRRPTDPGIRLPAVPRFAEDDPLKSPYPYVGAGQMR